MEGLIIIKKAILISIFILMTSLFIGCRSNHVNDNKGNTNAKPPIQADLPINQTDFPNNTDSVNDNEETVANSFFFKSNVSQLGYKGQFLFDDMIEKDVKLNINLVDNLRHGQLFELKIDPIDGVPNERLSLGYFYVQKEKLYKIEPTKGNLAKLKSSEQLPNDSVIVCQDEEIKDTLSENEPGWHYDLEVNGDKREYHSYNNQVSTGYYESFIWEKSRGLTHYKSGFGAERDSVELQLNNVGFAK